MYKHSVVLWFSLTEEDFNIETSFYKQLRFNITFFLFIKCPYLYQVSEVLNNFHLFS